MAAVSLLNVSVRNNPAPFNSPYEFEITFECLETLAKDLEWKLTYVGSATSYVTERIARLSHKTNPYSDPNMTRSSILYWLDQFQSA